MDRMFKSQRLAFAAMAAFIAGAVCIVSPAAHAQLVKIDGSSTVFPITEAMAEDFQKSKKGKVKVTVGISGTGGGFKKFCRGETDISDASRPILKKEMDDCKAAGVQYIELPVAYDALTVVIHPDNKWAQTLTVAELRKMWEPGAQGKIKTWKQVNPAWPDEPLKLFGAGADSGTFDYFTEAINGKAKSSRGDFTAFRRRQCSGARRIEGSARAGDFLVSPITWKIRTNSKRWALWPKKAASPSCLHLIPSSTAPISRWRGPFSFT
jgi:phosphate transport system substrate-binding protein